MNKFWRAVFNRRMLICIFTGFASGMPLYVLIQLVPWWLRDENLSLAAIGGFALIGLPYTWKFIWAPLVDRYWIKIFGRRRTWMLITQIGLIPAIAFLPQLSPSTQIWSIAALCGLISFLSATQDISLDAYRRELLPDEELGFGTSVHVNAYRISGLIPGGLSLILWDHMPSQVVFPITAAFMFIGIALTLTIKEPETEAMAPRTLHEAVIDPFKEFFLRRGYRQALYILAFIFLYKLGDNLAVALSTPFYYDLGFSGTEVGTVAKLVGLWSAIIGGVIGGLVMIAIGINRALWIFGFVQIVSILGFALLARIGDNIWMLGVAHGFEYLGVGLGTAAIGAFMARESSKAYTATQFALFTALAAVPRTLANSTTGLLVEAMGWETFFYFCTLMAIPGMLLLAKIAPWNAPTESGLTKSTD
ncbi:MAG: AmpG family muropeptide MFS transporter [Porticoccaceae bacterium]|jgi:MFS transporter, PAT family, beta-lactamase induction signal transducer AmpG|nr:AmpG family muropeptide MFS transporter [Porticoccaceae bacterium]